MLPHLFLSAGYQSRSFCFQLALQLSRILSRNYYPHLNVGIVLIQAALCTCLTSKKDTQAKIEVEKLEQMKQAMQIINGRAEVEVSGNVTKENIARLTDLGVDYISSGALTHSAPILDISLKNLHAV